MQKTKSVDEKRMDWLQKHVPRLDVKSGKVWVCWGCDLLIVIGKLQGMLATCRDTR